MIERSFANMGSKGKVTVFFDWSKSREEKFKTIFRVLNITCIFRPSTFEGQYMMTFGNTYSFLVTYVLRYFDELTDDVVVVPF